MQPGTCALCLRHRDLCVSHALPEALFRFLFKRGSGKAVVVVDDQSTKTGYSSERWSDHLLCKDCEADLNQRFDSYGINVFKGQFCSIRTTSAGTTFTGIDRQRLRTFVLSVLWRMAASSNEAYAGVQLSHVVKEEIRAALYEKRSIRSSLAEVGITQLKGSTVVPLLSGENLKSMILAPFTQKHGTFESIGFLFFGFVIEVFMPRPARKFMSGIGVASGTSPILLAPFQDVSSFGPLLNLLVRGMDKHDQGLSRVA
jgi:hypothetical protein